MSSKSSLKEHLRLLVRHSISIVSNSISKLGKYLVKTQFMQVKKLECSFKMNYVPLLFDDWKLNASLPEKMVHYKQK